MSSEGRVSVSSFSQDVQILFELSWVTFMEKFFNLFSSISFHSHAVLLLTFSCLLQFELFPS